MAFIIEVIFNLTHLFHFYISKVLSTAPISPLLLIHCMCILFCSIGQHVCHATGFLNG